MTRGAVNLTVTVPAEVSQLRLLTGLVRRCLVDAAGLYPSSADYQQIQIAVREACSNVVEHAYRGRSPGTLQLGVEINADGITIKIEDRGSAVPGDRIRRARAQASDPSLLVEGGYGLRLIQDTMDQVVYQRMKDGTNIVRLYKRIAQAA